MTRWKGNAILFASQSAVEAEWNVVDRVLAERPPLHPYDAGSWGPAEAERLTQAFGGWYKPGGGGAGG